jgi:hypothetical protein
LNSKEFEEVRKRRAKASPGWLNPYQKIVLLAGVLALVFSIGLGPRIAPFLAAGVAAGSLLLFLIFKNLKRRKERKNEAASQETSSEEDKTLEPDPISYRADVEIIGDSPEAISEHTNWDALEDSISLDPAEAIITPGTSAAEIKGLSPTEEFSGEGLLTQLPEKVTKLEEKVINLEDMLRSLENRLTDMQERKLEREPKIDLQTILMNPEEKHGNFEAQGV